jgi:hypothetical protein
VEEHESDKSEDGKKQEQHGVAQTSPPTEVSAKSRKPFIQELKPWSSINPNTNLLNLIFRPWPLIVYPAGFYAMLLFSLIVGWSVCVINTNASIFQAPPYLMTPGINSVGIKVPSFIGCAIGMYTSGALADRYVEWRARKNHGIYEPETRLVMLIPAFFIIPAGLLMYSLGSWLIDRYGFGVQHHTAWPLPFIANGFIGFGLAAVPTVMFTYCKLLMSLLIT